MDLHLSTDTGNLKNVRMPSVLAIILDSENNDTLKKRCFFNILH